MRSTFDRLIGPVAAVLREPNPRVITEGDEPYPVLVPVRLDEWRVVTGRGPTADLRREVAECVGCDDSVTAAAASRFGLRGEAEAVDADRAGELMRSIQRKLLARKSPGVNDPLISYPAGHDPREWAKLSAVETLAQDRGDWIANGVEWCLAVLSRPPSSVEWERRARVVAHKWTGSDGIGRLQRLVFTQLSKEPAIERAAWPAVLAHALLRKSGAVKDARSLWHALVVVAPLLLAMAEASSTAQDRERKPRLDLLIERVEDWQRLSREANAWHEFVDELTMLEEEMAESAKHRHAEQPSTVEIKGKVEELYSALQTYHLNFDLRQSLDHLNASDTEGIWVAIRDVMARRLAVAGVGLQTPGGTLITAEAAVLLSIRKSFEGGSCLVCGAKTRGRTGRCRVHKRVQWREEKQKQRGRTRSAKTVPPGGSARSVRAYRLETQMTRV